MANVAIQLHQLEHSAIVELFELDLTIVGGPVYRFHNGTNQVGGSVVWQGLTYLYFPIEVEGYGTSGNGPSARPMLRGSNVNGVLSVLIRAYKGMKGAKLTRRRTLAKYLDAVNFPGGVNPLADPTTTFADDVHFLEMKTRDDPVMVEYQLSSALDLDGLMLPRRQIQHAMCQWVKAYRGTDCGYTGAPVAKADDTPTALLAEDKCGGRLSSCRLRLWPDRVLNFGGFPGAGVIRNA